MTKLYRKKELFSNMPVLAVVLDENGRFSHFSDKWVERTGYSPAELRGRSPEDIATPESAKRIRDEHLPGFHRTGKLDHVPVGFVAKDGAVLELLMKSRAVVDDAGKQLYSISVFFETSALARAERRYEDLYHSTPAMLHTIDPEGRITDVSDHWLDKLEYEREEVIGRTILDFLSSEDGEKTKVRLKEIFGSAAS